MAAWRALLRQPQQGWRSHTWALLAEISVASLRVEDASGATESVNLGSALREVLRMQWRALLILLALFAIKSEEHTSELQSLMRISYAVFCLKKKKTINMIQRQIKK